MTSPLQSVTPSGPAGRSLVIGSGCPASLAPADTQSADPFDLVVVAPGPAEGRDATWPIDAARRAAAAVATDGVVYVIAPARTRRPLVAELERTGLSSGVQFVHLPSFENTRVVAPVRTGPLRYALRQFAIGSRRKRLAAAAVLRLPGALRLVGARSDVAVALRRPSAPPLFAWLPDPTTDRTAVIVFPLSRTNGALGFHEFASGGRTPVAVDKLLPSAADAAKRSTNIDAACVHARAAGAHTPEVLGSFPEIPLIRQSVVPGVPGHLLLDRRPQRLGSAVDAVGAWLARWHELTAEQLVVDRARLGEWIFEPLSELTDDLPADGGYEARLRRLCSRVEGRSVPLVWAHGDLTMSNVLLRRGGGLSVVDWETARPAQLPLHDLYYALADAAAATERYSNRVAAVRECFADGGRYVPMAARWRERMAGSVGIDHDAALLSFHACWLHHAAIERATQSVASERPFARILRFVAESNGLMSGLSVG
jgi:hypothetical protein